MLYKEKDSDSQPRFWLVEGNASRSAQLTGLGKYVLYEVQVLAFTRIGDGSPSHPAILERTLDDGTFPSLGAWGRLRAAFVHPYPAQPCPAPLRSLSAPKGTVASGFCWGKQVTEGHQPHCKGC